MAQKTSQTSVSAEKEAASGTFDHIATGPVGKKTLFASHTAQVQGAEVDGRQTMAAMGKEPEQESRMGRQRQGQGTTAQRAWPAYLRCIILAVLYYLCSQSTRGPGLHQGVHAAGCWGHITARPKSLECQKEIGTTSRASQGSAAAQTRTMGPLQTSSEGTYDEGETALRGRDGGDSGWFEGHSEPVIDKAMRGVLPSVEETEEKTDPDIDILFANMDKEKDQHKAATETQEKESAELLRQTQAGHQLLAQQIGEMQEQMTYMAKILMAPAESSPIRQTHGMGLSPTPTTPTSMTRKECATLGSLWTCLT